MNQGRAEEREALGEHPRNLKPGVTELTSTRPPTPELKAITRPGPRAHRSKTFTNDRHPAVIEEEDHPSVIGQGIATQGGEQGSGSKGTPRKPIVGAEPSRIRLPQFVWRRRTSRSPQRPGRRIRAGELRQRSPALANTRIQLPLARIWQLQRLWDLGFRASRSVSRSAVSRSVPRPTRERPVQLPSQPPIAGDDFVSVLAGQRAMAELTAGRESNRRRDHSSPYSGRRRTGGAT